jgi:GDPmannose 4,6-dehydratase
MLLTVNPTAGEYYNIGGDYTCTVEDTLYHLVRLSTVSNIQIVVDQERLRPIDADLQLPDTSKFKRHTGWKPEISYETTMLDLLNYWRDKIKTGRKFLRR